MRTKQYNYKATEELSKLDKLLEHRSRLGVCVLLAEVDAMSFTAIKNLLKETDGNMGAQLRKLEEFEYISVSKRFENRKPKSWYSITKKGKRALKIHLNALKMVIEMTIE